MSVSPTLTIPALLANKPKINVFYSWTFAIPLVLRLMINVLCKEITNFKMLSRINEVLQNAADVV